MGYQTYFLYRTETLVYKTSDYLNTFGFHGWNLQDIEFVINNRLFNHVKQ